MNIKIKPLGDRVMVLINKSKSENTSSIIMLEEEQKDIRTVEGVIVAVGDGKQVADSGILNNNIVLFKKFGGEEMELDGETYKILEYSDIIAIIE